MSSPNENASSVGTVLARCHRACARAAAEKTRDFELTYSQFRVLEALYSGGPRTLGRLADRLVMAAGNVTYVMERLESRGLAVRRRRTHDRRVVIAELTPEGRALAEDVVPQYAAHLERLSDGLSSVERLQLSRLLGKLAKAIAESDLP